MDRGFDHFFGFLGGFSDHFKGGPGYRLDRGDFKDFGPDFYSSDAFADRAIRFIGSASDKPFFLCLSYQAPHNPLQAPRGLIDPYRGKYLKGWQAVREERFRRQKEMGIVSADVELPAYPLNLPAWDSLSPAQKDLEDLRRAVYAAMVGRMDESIGRVMDCLRASGKADNTLVLFLSDNGADPFSVADEAMLKQNKLPGDPGSNYQNGVGWAYAGATPWRLYKISQHGGGVTSGAIARWPGKLGKPGRIERAPLHVADVMPMLLDAADPGGPDAGLAGVSFLPLLRGEPWRREGPLCFQYLDNRALRDDEWTLVEADGAGWELFRTSDDYLEIRDLAASRPETVARLADQWLSWWKRESGSPHYTPESSSGSPHYKPQGDLGSGAPYVPSAMPKRLSGRYPVPK
jgi:arylsulfatase